MKDLTPFRHWLENMWYVHKMEIESYTGKFPDYPKEEYFKKYKWWLKREFVHRNKQVEKL